MNFLLAALLLAALTWLASKLDLFKFNRRRLLIFLASALVLRNVAPLLVGVPIHMTGGFCLRKAVASVALVGALFHGCVWSLELSDRRKVEASVVAGILAGMAVVPTMIATRSIVPALLALLVEVFVASMIGPYQGRRFVSRALAGGLGFACCTSFFGLYLMLPPIFKSEDALEVRNAYEQFLFMWSETMNGLLAGFGITCH